MNIGERIRNKRKEMGWTLDDLSKKVHVSRQTILRYESGDIKNIPSDKIELIARALHISPSYLMGWDDEPPAKNLIIPNARAVPILGRIACGNGTFLEDSFHGEFVLDSSIKADYCLIVSGDSMIDAGIEHGDKVFLRKTYDIHDGKIYGVVLKGEDVATLKMIFVSEDEKRYTLQPCNSSGEYKTICVDADSVFIAGECIGIYKTI